MNRLPTRTALGLALAVVAGLAGCSSSKAPPPAATSAPAPQPAGTPAPALSNTPQRVPAGSAKAGPKGPSEVRTRNAMFKLASYDELPGWQEDDMRASWSAFRNSCDVLQKRDDWREICASAKTVPPNTRAMRSFFESRFTLLRILHTDARGDGDVTGYFEPLLEGQMQRDAEFNTPVLGVPRDLYTIDWTRVPKAQRRSVVRVRAEGNLLLPAQPGDAATYAMDMRRFQLDDRDRRLRVRLVGRPGAPDARVEPYYTRAELEALGLPQGIDAPVVVWVNDPLALYAMQVQGSGRVRMPDGQIMRLQYAEQNGHPFKPLRVVPRQNVRVATRGIGDPGPEQPDSFVIEGDTTEEAADEAPVLTRGMSVNKPAQGTTASSAKVDPLVDELLKGARKSPNTPAGGSNAGSNAGIPAKRPPPPTTPAATPAKTAVTGRLSADPSFVFFKTVADRPLTEGPQGALGVPLTPGRSVAVDPRVTPLGYPVYLSAPAPKGSAISMQRLVFAQDTGGAIRGAVRADYFWGFGNEAGQMARSTKHRGQMWVMLPTAEANRLATSKLLTRGVALGGGESSSSCLVPDGEFCAEVD
ncbi:MltA domain-containing protein [Rhizobacter sp. J219]|uniref:MltA domain-containing protein n=1 Tax=Rhizobacter sp. J219 TaxID=2898430 RepID=UPI002151B5BC|nr:MltA domain-containing protein [Rhizobacter sp. J219]MCR5882498.1 MltA domain-containing protein [Rhizobacter sp. J219]